MMAQAMKKNVKSNEAKDKEKITLCTGGGAYQKVTQI